MNTWDFANLKQRKTEYEKIMYLAWRYNTTYRKAIRLYNFLRKDFK